MPSGTLQKWGKSNNSACPLCTNTQTIGHVVGGYTVTLNEKIYNWIHDSILLAIANCMSKFIDWGVYCDIDVDDFPCPSIITVDEKHPDIANHFGSNCRLRDEDRKNQYSENDSYATQTAELTPTYNDIFVNLGMGTVGIIGKSVKNMKAVFRELDLSDLDFNDCINRVINVFLRTCAGLLSLADHSQNRITLDHSQNRITLDHSQN